MEKFFTVKQSFNKQNDRVFAGVEMPAHPTSAMVSSKVKSNERILLVFVQNGVKINKKHQEEWKYLWTNIKVMSIETKSAGVDIRPSDQTTVAQKKISAPSILSYVLLTFHNTHYMKLKKHK